MSSLFEAKSKERAPLADRLRPAAWNDFVGQAHVVAPLKKLIASGKTLPSIIFWGPPGSGKTTLARLIATTAKMRFTQFSAVTSGIKEVREAVEAARMSRGGTILFVDEIHRFNRAQQDAFLPHIEDGTIVLIGATTENPSFELNTPLLSRAVVYRLTALADDDVGTILDRAKIPMDKEARGAIVNLANGDARIALNLAEMCGHARGKKKITAELVREVAQRRVFGYDRDREEHYNIISAFIKSMRGSDPHAAVYWLARMLEAGEDPLFIARRMVIFAAEDVGNADPRALMVAVAVRDAVDFVGMPEGFLPLSQGVTYLATAPKSNAALTAYLDAKKDVESTRNDPVPLHLRNAPTKLMKDSGYGKGYQYPHDFAGAKVDQEFLPDNLRGREYYKPKDAGVERDIAKRMNERKRK